MSAAGDPGEREAAPRTGAEKRALAGTPGALLRGLALSVPLPALLALLLFTRAPPPAWSASAVLGTWIGCVAGLVAWGALGGRRDRPS